MRIEHDVHLSAIIDRDRAYNDRTPPCYFNEGVGCYTHKGCSHCGWNPKVAEERIREMKKQT